MSKERQVFAVHVPANVYDGKYYDYRTKPFNVTIGEKVQTEQDAIDYVNNHQEEVLENFNRARFRYGNTSRRAVPKDVRNNVFFKPTYAVRGPFKVISVED